MTTLNLKDAHRLEQALNGASEQVRLEAMEARKLTLSAYDTSEPIAAKVAKQRTKVELLIAEAQELLRLRYVVRRMIQRYNTEAGLDDMLNQVAALLGRARMLDLLAAVPRGSAASYLRSTSANIIDPDALAGLDAKFAAVRESAGGAIAREDKVELLSVLDRRAVESYRTVSAALKRQLEKLKDEIAARNLRTNVIITFTGGEHALLDKHNIHYGAEG